MTRFDRDDPSTTAQQPHAIHLARAHEEFALFFARYEPQVTGFLWRMLGDESSAADLCQETFLRAWQHFATINTYDKPIAWLLKVATRLALQHLRRRQAPVGAATPLDETWGPASSDHSRRVAEQDHVSAVLQTLSPKLRTILLLRDVHGFMGPEIASMLHMSLTAVSKALWRATRQFRATYDRLGGQ